eukprot:1187147-Prorocentrum_minimum.AAC.5
MDQRCRTRQRSETLAARSQIDWGSYGATPPGQCRDVAAIDRRAQVFERAKGMRMRTPGGKMRSRVMPHLYQPSFAPRMPTGCFSTMSRIWTNPNAQFVSMLQHDVQNLDKTKRTIREHASARCPESGQTQTHNLCVFRGWCRCGAGLHQSTQAASGQHGTVRAAPSWESYTTARTWMQSWGVLSWQVAFFRKASSIGVRSTFEPCANQNVASSRRGA